MQVRMAVHFLTLFLCWISFVLMPKSGYPMRNQMKTTRILDTISKTRVVFIRFLLGIKSHARDQLIHFWMAFGLMNNLLVWEILDIWKYVIFVKFSLDIPYYHHHYHQCLGCLGSVLKKLQSNIHQMFLFQQERQLLVSATPCNLLEWRLFIFKAFKHTAANAGAKNNPEELDGIYLCCSVHNHAK